MKNGNFGKICSNKMQKRKSFIKKRKIDPWLHNRIKRFSKTCRNQDKSKSQLIVNPKDPLNLLELEKQEEERFKMGLSPLPGDSAFNTPIINSGHNTNELTLYRYFDKSLKYKERKDNRFTQYFNGYHYKTKPEDRLKYFLPDWFNQSYVCDYGCHRGDFSFKLFELFHNHIVRLDCIDVRKNCLLNAKHILREKKRCELMRQLKSDFNCDNNNNTILDYNKIFFKYGNWVKDRESSDIRDESEYDIIIALGVTKLIHLYYGDNGLEKFLRRACHRLKPGGHLIVELQSKSKYIEAVKDIGKPFIAKNFKNIKIQPDKLEPLLASVGFPYCCKINTTLWNKKNDQGDILLCTKPIGTTPVPIRDINTSELMLKYTKHKADDNSILYPHDFNPPPVVYNPQSSELCASNDEETILISDNEINGNVDNEDDNEKYQMPDSTMNDDE